MAFPIVFVWFVIAIFIFRHHMRKSSRAQETVSKAFWSKEESSLVVRKKALSPEDYVTIHLTEDDLKDEHYYQRLGVPQLYRQNQFLKELMSLPMANFQHVTNTDIRLTFGTAMITAIEKYEENYNAYVNALYKMGKKLLEAGDSDFGCQLLEEGVLVGTDNRKHYLVLAAYYKQQHNTKGLEALITKATHLESLTKDALLKELTVLMNE